MSSYMLYDDVSHICDSRRSNKITRKENEILRGVAKLKHLHKNI